MKKRAILYGKSDVNSDTEGYNTISFIPFDSLFFICFGKNDIVSLSRDASRSEVNFKFMDVSKNESTIDGIICNIKNKNDFSAALEKLNEPYFQLELSSGPTLFVPYESFGGIFENCLAPMNNGKKIVRLSSKIKTISSFFPDNLEKQEDVSLLLEKIKNIEEQIKTLSKRNIVIKNNDIPKMPQTDENSDSLNSFLYN